MVTPLKIVAGLPVKFTSRPYFGQDNQLLEYIKQTTRGKYASAPFCMSKLAMWKF
jgi:hypothetical protein